MREAGEELTAATDAQVRNRWDDSAAPRHHDAVEVCAYVSRLLGSDPAVVLHGGGNTSVKTTVQDVTGEQITLVHVKASGHDLGTITRDGFAPLRLDHLRRLVELPSLDDTAMVNEYRCASIDASAPTASIEAILHALLPSRFVLHSHADAVVTLTDTELSDAALLDVFGEDVEVLPYCRPGFDLARLVASVLAGRTRPPSALVLRHHGLFTFDDDAQAAYDRHIALINAAEQHIWRARFREATTANGSQRAGRADPRAAKQADSHATDQADPQANGWTDPEATGRPHPQIVAALRAAVARAAGFPVLLQAERDAEIDAFLARENVGAITRCGTATLEHVIRTKAWPLIGRDVQGFVAEYEARFARLAAGYEEELVPLDPAPRVILDDQVGLITVGRTPGELGSVRDIYRHTIRIISDGEALGGYRSVGDADLFDIEYWELEQAKLRRVGHRPPLTGQVAVVADGPRGEASVVATAFADAGAQVVRAGGGGDPAVQVRTAVLDAVGVWGGVDVICLPGGLPVDPAAWLDVLQYGWDGGREVRVRVTEGVVSVAGPSGWARGSFNDGERMRAALLLVL